MAVKLMHYWTVIPSENHAYADFIINEFIPGINRLGMQTVAGWSVIVGSYSEVVLEAVSKDLDHMEAGLKSIEYRHLKSGLLNFIKNYKTKILVSLEKDQAYSMNFGADTIKFNQVWDVITREKDDFKKYRQFVTKEFYPVLEQFGVTIASEWEVLIGDGPRTICEGRVNDVRSLISSLQSARFRQVKDKLKTYVENYESRILSFHIRRQSEGSSESYQIMDD